jgi:subtilisin family serine protease
LLESLGIRQLWEETFGDPRIRVAVIDGSVDCTHPCLLGARLVSLSALPVAARGVGTASDHGTQIASIIFGQHSTGVWGIAPRCEGVILPVFADAAHGALLPCTQLDLALALDRALEYGVHVINLSAGGFSPTGAADAALTAAVRRCIETGILLVAASGNQGCECLTVPGALPAVLAVGAMDRVGNPLEASNWGSVYQDQGIVAPGEDVLGAIPGGGTRLGSGTSYAAAIVSGIAGLLLSLQLQYGQKPDPLVIRRVLLDSAIKREGDPPQVLGGRLSLPGAIALVMRTIHPAPRYSSQSANSAATASYRADILNAPKYNGEPIASSTMSPFAGAYVPASDALDESYGGVARDKFGTVDIELFGGESYNVRDLHYFLSDRRRGMYLIPVRDAGEVATPDGSQVPGYQIVDDFLRGEMALDSDDPIYALLSYIRPEEHTIPLLNLPQTLKRQLGHQHLGAYLGQGSTSHALEPPSRLAWPTRDGRDLLNVKGRPANLHLISLAGVPQRTLNWNAHIVDLMLTTNVLVPANTQNIRCRVVDLNTTLQFYRDWIHDAEYLTDLSWYTNCANHKTIVVNVMLNLPHNPARFHQIFGDDGRHLWHDFCHKFRRLTGEEFTEADETEFEPLWHLEGLTADSIRPQSLAEHNAFRAAKLERRLEQYGGPRPLEPGQGMAWPLETLADFIAGFISIYVSFIDAGGIIPAAMLITIADHAAGVLAISSMEYRVLVAPAIKAFLAADALLHPSRGPEWRGQAARTILAGLRSHDDALARDVEAYLDAAVATADDLAKDGRPALLTVAQWLNQALAAALEHTRSEAVADEDRAGFFSSPGILQRIASRMYEKSRFVNIRTVGTVMEHDEIELRGSPTVSARPAPLSRTSQGKLPPVRKDANPSLGVATMNQLHDDNPTSAPSPSSLSPDPSAVIPSSSDPSASSCSVCGGPLGTCSCNSNLGSPRLVYALGKLDHDLVSQSRRDSLKQRMEEVANPENPEQLLAYLERNPWDASAVHWVLTIDNTPIYVIQPQGPFARELYDQLRRFLHEQLAEGVERISVPGVITGAARLRSGLAVPVVAPEIRGMYSWSTEALVAAIAGEPPAPAAPEPEREAFARQRDGVRNFLDRVYYELRNPGLAPHERAINFAATNAFEVGRIYESAIRDEMELDTIEFERTPVSHPGIESWDVKLLFFFPLRQVQTVRRIYRLTVDVTDVVPVTVGTVRSWFTR